jgi:hydrogenase/urease accessory protein HupE
MKLVRDWLSCAVLLLAAGNAQAHELTLAEMELRETTPGEFLWQWTSSGTAQPGEGLTAVWPEGCTAEAAMLRCRASEGLRGTLTVAGIGDRYSAALVKIYWIDGQTSVHTLTTAQPEVRLFGSADDRRGSGEIARAYLVLGIEHILSGIDHLAFVVALLFLVGFNRRLVYTITAFTLAHSVTLAASALGWLALRPPPVEAAIALSIALVAGEALRKEATLARRLPALVAFLFGLVHGLGFAGALQEIGLPQNHVPMALLAFNVGVELGQLALVALAYVAYRALAGRPALVFARAPTLYAIGAVAAYWSIERVVGLVAGA